MAVQISTTDLNLWVRNFPHCLVNVILPEIYLPEIDSEQPRYIQNFVLQDGPIHHPIVLRASHTHLKSYDTVPRTFSRLICFVLIFLLPESIPERGIISYFDKDVVVPQKFLLIATEGDEGVLAVFNIAYPLQKMNIIYILKIQSNGTITSGYNVCHFCDADSLILTPINYTRVSEGNYLYKNDFSKQSSRIWIKYGAVVEFGDEIFKWMEPKQMYPSGDKQGWRKTNFKEIIESILKESLHMQDNNRTRSTKGYVGRDFPLIEGESILMFEYYFGYLDVGIEGTSIYLTSTKSFNFITCDGMQLGLSFQAFLKPYQTPAWMFILTSFLTLTLTCISISICVNRQYWRESCTSKAAGVALKFIKTVFEQGANFQSKLYKSGDGFTYFGVFNAIFAIWLLALLVLINAYKGIVVTDVIAALPHRAMYEKISQLTNFTILTYYDEKIDPRGDPGKGVYKSKGKCKLRVNGKPITEPRSALEEAFESFRNAYHTELSLSLNIKESDMDFIMNIEGRLYSCKKEDVIESAVKLSYDCNSKIAVVDFNSNIDELKYDLLEHSQKQQTFLKGKDKYLVTHYGWKFSNAGGPQLPRTLQAILHSGIYSFWQKWFEEFKPEEKPWRPANYTRVYRQPEFKPQSMNSNILTIFIIAGVLLSSACIALIVELMCNVKYKKCSHIIDNVVKSAWRYFCVIVAYFRLTSRRLVCKFYVCCYLETLVSCVASQILPS